MIQSNIVKLVCRGNKEKKFVIFNSLTRIFITFFPASFRE